MVTTAVMKQDHHISRRHVAKILVPAAYAAVLFLTFAFGYFSAPSSRGLLNTPITSVPATAALPQITNLPSELDHFRVTTLCAADPVPPHLVRRRIIDLAFNSTSPYQDFPPAHVSALLRQKRIKGWGSNAAVFEHLIRRVRPRTIIEVGTFLGASAIHMANLTRQLGLETQVLCIDDFRGWPGFQKRFVRDIPSINGDVWLMYQFMQNVVHVNMADSILPVPFSSGSALSQLCEWGVLGDLIEIDAGHDFNSAWTDISKAYRILRQGGVIFGHDYFNHVDKMGVKRAVDLFAKINGLSVHVDGKHWVLELGR